MLSHQLSEYVAEQKHMLFKRLSQIESNLSSITKRVTASRNPADQRFQHGTTLVF